MVREVEAKDLEGLMELYTHLHEDSLPEGNEALLCLWEEIINDKNHHIIVAEENGKIVSSCVCIVIPNLTRNQRSYALVENVVTHNDYRKRGLAKACLNYAKDIAIRKNCYKVMLMTGAKEESVLKFYENAGYNYKDKTAFIQWI